MDKWISINLGSTPGELALGLGTEGLASSTLEGHRHTEGLLPATQRLLKELGWGMEDLSGLYGSSGPGGFTGMRVATATLKAFALALQLPVSLVGSAETMARAWAAVHGPQPLWVATRAGTRRFCVSKFDASLALVEQGLVEELTGPCAVPVLVETTLPQAPAHWNIQLTPLKAADLVRWAGDCASTVTARTVPEIVELSPQYLPLSYKKWDRAIATFDDAATKPQCPKETLATAQTRPTPG